MGNDPVYGSYLTIDPSVGSLGYALWREHNWLEPVPPFFTGLLEQGSDEGSFEYRMLKMGWMVGQLIKPNYVRKVWIEDPAFFAGDAGGHAVAAQGSLVKLAEMVGCICGYICSRDHEVEISLLPVRTWKGQLPKAVVNERIKKVLPHSAWRKYKLDMWDAVGMGLYLKGAINR